MLWWFIGAWFASAAVFYRFLAGPRPTGTWIASKVSRRVLYVFSGLVSIGALVLLFVCSISKSTITMRDMPSASAVARTATTQVADARPILLLDAAALSPSLALFSELSADIDSEREIIKRGLLGEPLSLDEADLVASIQPLSIRTGGRGAGGDAAQQVPAAATILTAPLYPTARRAQHSSAHRRASRTSVRPYVTQSASHGTWLFAPNSIEGANN